jgi:integrase
MDNHVNLRLINLSCIARRNQSNRRSAELTEKMPGKQAKLLAADQIDNLLLFAETTRYPLRDRVTVLLSVKAGLRAAEIANLTWEMVLDPNGAISATLELRDRAAKKGHGRIIPLHASLRDALASLRGKSEPSRPVVLSERGSKMKARSIVIWFSRAYRAVGLDGCSSHSGRRTFITRAARLGHIVASKILSLRSLAVCFRPYLGKQRPQNFDHVAVFARGFKCQSRL